MAQPADFQEIAHTGGQVIIRVATSPEGHRSYQIGWQHCRPNAAVIFAVYALPQGIVVGQAELGGIGHPVSPAPVPGCYLVFVGSDSEGRFGHQCPVCAKYWRGELDVQFCPYCGFHSSRLDFLSNAQRAYIHQCCVKMREALTAERNGEYVIDMDAVADAAGKDAEKPAFYYAEESQQSKFTCNACGGFNDILGTFGYCAMCGTRNDFQELSTTIIPRIRVRINAGGPYEDCVRDSVAVFDSFVGQYVSQLIKHVPLIPARKNRIENKRFHNLQLVTADLNEIFGIDITDGLKVDDIEFAKIMFCRRHVYEHNGGEADERYIAESGDNSVRVKQALRETAESAHRIAGLILRMASNLHHGFHEILRPEQGPIQRHRGYAVPIEPRKSKQANPRPIVSETD